LWSAVNEIRPSHGLRDIRADTPRIFESPRHLDPIGDEGMSTQRLVDDGDRVGRMRGPDVERLDGSIIEGSHKSLTGPVEFDIVCALEVEFGLRALGFAQCRKYTVT
jgi:hypothetical protein